MTLMITQKEKQMKAILRLRRCARRPDSFSGFFFVMFCLFTTTNPLHVSNAQTPQYYNYNTITETNSFPFNIDLGKQVQLLYLAGDFSQPTPAPAGTIVSLSFIMAEDLGPYTYSDMVIKVGQTDISVFDPGVWYTGQLDTPYYRPSVIHSGIAGQWLTIQLDRPFAYNPDQGLIVELMIFG